MLRRPIRTSRGSKKQRIFFVLILLLLIGFIILITKSYLSKKALLISPIASTSIQDERNIEILLVDAQIAFVSVSLEQDSYKIKLQDGGDVVLSLKKNLDKQITSLQPILKQLTIEGKKFNRIDFRFDKPLVVYE